MNHGKLLLSYEWIMNERGMNCEWTNYMSEHASELQVNCELIIIQL
jgi:hypothetical protein